MTHELDEDRRITADELGDIFGPNIPIAAMVFLFAYPDISLKQCQAAHTALRAKEP